MGRAEELARLEDARRRVAPGRPTVALVHGPSGIGKSALVHAFTEQARASSALVLAGRCYEREHVPFKAIDGWIDDLGRHIAALPSVEGAALVPRDTDALVRLFPALLRVDAIRRACRGREAPNDPIESRRRGARALRELLQRCGDAVPLVLLVDDAQWSDEDSSAVIAEVLLPPDAPSLVLVLAYRDEPAGNRLSRAAVPSNHVELVDIPLGPLDASSTRSLARHSGAVDAVQLEHIVRESGGNPLFLGELARAAASTPGVSLEDVVLRRVRQLPDAARAMVETVAVAGQPTARDVLARAARSTVESEHDVLTLLRRESLVRVHGNGEIEIYHDRLRDVIAASLSTQAARTIHASLADALAETPSPSAPRMARHLRLAGDLERARTYAETAGDDAMRALAFERAAGHYDDALNSGALRADLLEKLAFALIGAGRGKDAAETLLRASALEVGDASDDLRRRAVEQYFRTGLFEEGIDTLKGPMTALGLRVPRSRWITVLLLYWNIALLMLLGWRMTKRSDPFARRRALLCEAVTPIANYDAMRASVFAVTGLRHARHGGDQALHARLLAQVGHFGQQPAMMAEVARVASTSTGADRRFLEGLLEFDAATAAASKGRFADALASLRSVEQGTEGGQFAWERGIVRTWLLQTLWMRGELHEYVRRAHEHLQEYRSRGDAFGVAWAEIRWMHRVLLLEDRVPEARALAERLANGARSRDDAVRMLAHCALCECAIVDGDPVAARTARVRFERMTRTSLLMVRSAMNPMRALALGDMGLAAVVEGNAARAERIARRLEREREFGAHLWYGRVIRAGLSTGAAASEDCLRAASDLAAE